MPTRWRAKSEIMRINREAGVDVTSMDPATVASAGAFTIQLLIRPRAVNVPGSIMGRAMGDTHEAGGSAVLYHRVLRSAHEREWIVAVHARTSELDFAPRSPTAARRRPPQRA